MRWGRGWGFGAGGTVSCYSDYLSAGLSLSRSLSMALQQYTYTRSVRVSSSQCMSLESYTPPTFSSHERERKGESLIRHAKVASIEALGLNIEAVCLLLQGLGAWVVGGMMWDFLRSPSVDVDVVLLMRREKLK